MAKLFPQVISVATQPCQTELQLHIAADIHYFDGHFPDAPILAGVTQLHWAVHYSKQYYPQLTTVSAVEVLKFQVMIKPDSQLTLLLEHPKPDIILFSYLQQGNKVASGRLKWQQPEYNTNV
ncbi:hypothetical protein QE250_11775 [Chromatiaceae bacterium AAb-1]|nr:hypothetical protein [Chromatiaceae bacterium AAb-1]